MTRFKYLNRAPVLLMALAIAVLFSAGCSKNPVGLTSGGPQLLQRSTSSSSVQLSPANLYAESIISSVSGGELSLLDVTLSIPPGAVPNDTLFSINIPDIMVFSNSFGTDGLEFDVPVTVTMSYRDADLSSVVESTVRLGWLNESTGIWENMDCQVDFVNKTVTGKLYHFSAYGLISD